LWSDARVRTDQRVDLVTAQLTALDQRRGHPLDCLPVLTRQPFGCALDASEHPATGGVEVSHDIEKVCSPDGLPAFYTLLARVSGLLDLVVREGSTAWPIFLLCGRAQGSLPASTATMSFFILLAPSCDGPRSTSVCASVFRHTADSSFRLWLRPNELGLAAALDHFARMPPAESLPTPKNFLAKTSFTQRLPLYRTEPFLDRFLSEGA